MGTSRCLHKNGLKLQVKWFPWGYKRDFARERER